MATKITKRLLDTAKLTNKAYEVWDAEVKGFHVIITPSRRKTFYFRYYDANRKNQRIKIGVFGNITCEYGSRNIKKFCWRFAQRD